MIKHAISADCPDQNQFNRILPQHRRILQACLQEFLHIASLSAVVLMGLNTISTSPDKDALSSVTGNAPPAPSVYPTIEAGLLDVPDRYLVAVQAIGEVYRNLADVKDLTWKILLDCDHLSQAELLQQPCRSVKKYWEELCGNSADTITALDLNGFFRIFDMAEQLRYSRERPLRIAEMLRRAASGEDRDGADWDANTAELPEWCERRRWMRRETNLNGRIFFNGRTHHVRIADISAGGAMLEGVGNVARGAILRIVISSGRAINCIACWSSDNSIGIRFDTPLELIDPLLSDTLV
jgi:hypothetical protein